MNLIRKQDNHIKTSCTDLAVAILLIIVFIGITGCQSKSGTSSEPGQSLGIASVPNLRDLGGYETKDGATVVRGLVYRSNQLAAISPEDMEKIAKLGLKNDYDLRTEAERTPLPDELPPGVNNIWLDVLKDASGSAPTNLSKYGTIENYFSEGLGIDATTQKALRDMYLTKK